MMAVGLGAADAVIERPTKVKAVRVWLRWAPDILKKLRVRWDPVLKLGLISIPRTIFLKEYSSRKFYSQ